MRNLIIGCFLIVFMSGCTGSIPQKEMAKMLVACKQSHQGLFEFRITFGVNSVVCKDGTTILSSSIPANILDTYKPDSNYVK